MTTDVQVRINRLSVDAAAMGGLSPARFQRELASALSDVLSSRQWSVQNQTAAQRLALTIAPHIGQPWRQSAAAGHQPGRQASVAGLSPGLSRSTQSPGGT